MPVKPKKKVKRKKSGALQKQKQTQIVTVNVAIPPRRRRRTKKPASGAGTAGQPPRQQFVQTIYPTTNPLQQDMQFNLASINAQLKNLQDKSVGGVSLGSLPTQQKIQLGNPEVEPIGVPSPEEVEPSPELQRDLPKKRKKKIVLVPESEDLLVFGGQEFRTAIDPAAARAAPTRKQRSDKDEPRGPLLRTAERDAFAHGASLMSIFHQDRPREQETPFRPANTYAELDRALSQPTIE